MKESNETKERIIFIDLIRAFAIIMMVQGHSIEVTLNLVFRDLTNPIYSAWAHLRGLTAPTFFFSSGVIFSYLLFNNKSNFSENLRAKKGIKRGLILIGVGYLLRLQPEIFTDFGNYKFSMLQKELSVDTLHCIGFGLLTIIGLWVFSYKTKINYLLISIPLAFMILFFSPIINSIDSIKYLPLFIANFFTFKYGSNFPIIPWLTFLLLGSSFGYLLSKKIWKINLTYHLVLLLSLGVFISYFSDIILMSLFEFTKFDSFIILYKNNYLLFHIGNVLILTSAIGLISKFWNQPSKIILKIGQNTLLIYILHIIIIYGTGFTVGVKDYYSNKLNISQSIILALIVITINIIIVNYKDLIINFFKKIKIHVT